MLLRRFGRDVFVVNTEAGSVQRYPDEGTGTPLTFDLGADSRPQDVLVWPVGQVSGHAFVTRRENPFLHGIDLATSTGADVLDLSPVGNGSPIALGTMIREGRRLFVQVRVTPAGLTNSDAGLLAVVDLPTLSLVDVEPGTPGVQGIELVGAPPRLKMQILEGALYVSATDSFLDGRGGIEKVDLESLTSLGFVLGEGQVADLGGFVMTSPEGGFFVFHTDFAASTHLKGFTVAGGPDPGPEILVLLGDTVDTLIHDPLLDRLFLPRGLAWNSPPGLRVIDATTRSPVGTGLVPLAERPRDAILVGPTWPRR